MQEWLSVASEPAGGGDRGVAIWPVRRWRVGAVGAVRAPGRIVLADGDQDQAALKSGVVAGLAQARVGAARSPRLVRSAPLVALVPSIGDGTVLITGGTGALGALVAEHLVRVYGVRDSCWRRGGARMPRARPR